MLIEFKTNGNGTAAGWYAEYSSISPTWCQGLKQFTEPSGTLSDGSGDFYYQGSATCKFRINPPFANKITLYFNSFNTEEGRDYVTIYDGTTQIAAFSGNEIPDPVEANSGSMFITWTSSVANNFQGWDAYYEVDNVGIHEDMPLRNLVISPVPATDEIQVSFLSEDAGSLQVKLVDMTGQILYAEEENNTGGRYVKVINVSHLPSGLYFMNISSRSGAVNRKIIIN
jgi:hypothetical protein